MATNDLERFLTRCIHSPPKGVGRAEKFVIKHLLRKAEDVDAIEIPEADECTEVAIASMANEIKSACDRDADGVGGVNKYAVRVVYENGEEGKGRFNIRAGNPDDDDEGFASEGPNARGLVTQLMRQNEAMFRATIMGMGSVIKSQGQMIEGLTTRFENVVKARFEEIDAVQAALDNKAERDARLEAERAKIKLKDKAAEQLFNIAPVIVNRLMEGKVTTPPGELSPEDRVSMTLFQSIESDQLEKIKEILNTEKQLSIILELFRQAEATEKKAKREPTWRAPHKLMDDLFNTLDASHGPKMQHIFAGRMDQLTLLKECYDAWMKRKAQEGAA